MTLRIRRGLLSELLGHVGEMGEPLWTVDSSGLYIGDGNTAGAVFVGPHLAGSGLYRDGRLIGLDYVSSDSRYVNVTGDTMTGDLYVSGNIDVPQTLANGSYLIKKGVTSWHDYRPAYRVSGIVDNDFINVFIGRNVGNYYLSGRADDDSVELTNTLLGGTSNYIIGENSMQNATSAASNVGIGVQVLRGVITASLSVALGEAALTALQEGDYNIGIGPYTGAFLTSGNSNIFIGEMAGINVQSGNHSIFIGTNAQMDNDTDGPFDNVVVIGHNAYAQASNQVVIGTDTTVQTDLFGNIIAHGFFYEGFDRLDTKYALSGQLFSPPAFTNLPSADQGWNTSGLTIFTSGNTQYAVLCLSGATGYSWQTLASGQ